MKECKKCHERKKLVEFRVNKNGGVVGECLACESVNNNYQPYRNSIKKKR